jgi:hypothetical protein
MLARSRQYGMVFYDDALCITGWNEGAQFITGSRFWSSGVSMALAGGGRRAGRLREDFS